MVRPLRQDRSTVVDTTITLRLTQGDRALLVQLVKLHSARLNREGTEATVASYVRRLIRRDAAARGLLRSPGPDDLGRRADVARTPRTRSGEGDGARRGRP
jgi:hypothetical protein